MKTPRNLRNVLNNLQENHCSFRITPSGEFTKVFPDTPSDYSKIIAQLDVLDVQHYYFADISVMPLKVVVRGLPIEGVTVETIQETVIEKEFQVLKVAQMVSFKTNKKMPLFQTHLTDNPKARKIFKLETLMYYIIKIENYNRPFRSIQCFNCQYFHHSSHNYKMNAKCLKCPENHDYRKCPLKKGQESKVAIVNCSLGHTANFRGYPKFPKRYRTFNSSTITPNKSVANVITSPLPQQPSTAVIPAQAVTSETVNLNSLSSILNEIVQEFKVNNVKEFIIKLKNILQKLRSATTIFDKAMILTVAFEQHSTSTP